MHEELRKLRRIERIVRYLLKGPADHEDIAMDIWLELYQKGEAVSFSFVRYRCIDWLRKRREERDPEDDQRCSRDLEPNDVEAQDLLQEIVKRVDLNQEDHLLLYRHYYNGETLADIARNERVSPSTITRRLQGILLRLRAAGEDLQLRVETQK